MATPPSSDAALHAERMARVDGCPECVANYEVPRMIRPVVGGFRADYRCADCGYAWTTEWSDC